jgi:Ca2+-binding EF-hand superfamily protein
MTMKTKTIPSTSLSTTTIRHGRRIVSKTAAKEKKVRAVQPVASSSSTSSSSTTTTTTTAAKSTEFVRRTRRELDRQIRLARERMELVDRLDGEMRGRLDRKLDFLFGLIDRDRSGAVDAAELAAVLRLRNSGLSEADAARRAEAMVAAFDADGNAQMDREEFETFVRTMLAQLRIDPEEFLDYLIWNIVYPEAMDPLPEGALHGPVRSSSHPSSPVPATEDVLPTRRLASRSAPKQRTATVGANAMIVPVRVRGKSRSRSKTAERAE